MIYSKKLKIASINHSLGQVEIQKHPNELLKKTLEVSASRQSGFLYDKQAILMSRNC